MLFFSAMSSVNNNIALIGFGEAASAFVEGWGAAWARHCRTYDIKTDSTRPGISENKYLDYEKYGVIGCRTLSAALRGSARIFSLVTADQILESLMPAGDRDGIEQKYSTAEHNER